MQGGAQQSKRPQHRGTAQKCGYEGRYGTLGDGLRCGQRQGLLVMTERASRKELIFKLKVKKQEYVKEALDRMERQHK